MRRQNIESFALYGEFGELDNPDFIHIEKISSRSRQFGGMIRPHIHHDLFQIIFILQGEAQLRIERLQRTVNGPCVLTLPPGTVHGFQFAPDTEGDVLTLAGSLPLSGADQRGKSLFEIFYTRPMVIDLADAAVDCQAIGELLASISAEHAWPQYRRNLMLEWLIQILLLRLHRRLLIDDRNTETPNAGHEWLNRFRTLVETHYRDHWEVQDYAQQLGLTEHHLTRLCREHLHKTPLSVIHRRLTLEAERKLIYTIDSVAMIADELGFKDPAYFSRQFKRKTGYTPSAYRQQRRLLQRT